MQTRASRKRSVVKAITYRGIIVCLDFLVIYLLTGKVMTAAAFMIVSNIYTTVAYFLHERVWARITWGVLPQNGILYLFYRGGGGRGAYSAINRVGIAAGGRRAYGQ